MPETTEEAIKRHERWLLEQEEAFDRHRLWLEQLDARMDRAEKRVDRIERLGLRRFGALETQVRMLADRQLTTQAALDRLTEQIDRFLQGQRGDGRDRG